MKHEPRRDKWGRALVVPPNGGKAVGYTRATTIAKTLDDEGGLSKWKMRQVCVGLAARPDLLALASTAGGDKGKLDRVAQSALDAAASDSRANLGTALHSLVETIVGGGEPIGVLPGLAGDLDAFRAVASGLELSHPECFVVHDGWQVAGTFDFVVRHPVTGRLVIGDLKTGADLSYSWRSIAVQLAIYAHAEHRYDIERDARLPMPELDRSVGIVVHLPAGEARCELYEVDLVAGLEAVERSLWTRQWRKARPAVQISTLMLADVPEPNECDCDTHVAAVMDEKAAERRAWLVERVEAIKARDVQVLARCWPIGVPTLKQSTEHTAEQLDAIQAAVEQAEATLRVPFEAEPPGGSPEPAPLPVELIEPSGNFLNCDQCNYDRHICPGCGAHLKHGQSACVSCSAPDEGEEFADLLIGVQVLREQVLEAVGAKLAGQWAAEANAAGCSLSMNRGTRRRHAIGRILVRVPELGEDVVRALIGHVLDSDQPLHPSTPFGAAVGCLGAAEAERVASLCISDGIELGIRPDGLLAVTALAPVA